ncbi:MAG: RsmE family RNA methyltransferase [Egibacteraceae bacterium]
MKGPHFLVPPTQIHSDRAVLTGDDARHLAVVLRAAPGEPVSLSDGAGRCWQARVVRARRDEVILRLVDARHVPRPRPRLTVVHALPKGRKLDDVVQRLAEIGVDRLVPVHSARSSVRLGPAKAAKAAERWRAVALAAAKQSRQAWLLDVAEVGEWAKAFPAGTPGHEIHGMCCWEESVTPLREVGVPMDADEIVLAIGPEGGLCPEEVAATGLPEASLGPTILRTETAALVAASIVLHRLGRLG